jgi:geranylgeranyl pyrophosphate synthase
MMPLKELVDLLEADCQVSPKNAGALRDVIAYVEGAEQYKTIDDVRFLRDLVFRQKSVDYARTVARKRARRASRTLASTSRNWPPSVHKEFLYELTDFVVNRDH